MNVPIDLAEAVRQRAGNRCQYCLMHQNLQGATFHVEHVIPKSKGGATALSNLALACPTCNLRKADLTSSLDPVTESIAALFHPVQEAWPEHFAIDGYLLIGLTPTGRATVSVLDLNHERRQTIRKAEEKFGFFPPTL